MPEMIDHIAHLSQEIGPRPAGTEEEQAAAAYIADAFQKDSGLEADIEDFGGVPAQELPTVICAGATILLTLLSMFLPVLRVPALLITLLAAGVFAAEAFGVPVLSRFLGNGVSQNVVARYIPPADPDTGSVRRRKIIFVSRYDSGRVRAELSGNFAGVQQTLNYAVLGGMVALPVLAFIRTVFLANVEGAPIIVLNVLSVVAIALAAVPVVVYILHQTAQYNDAANGSASGVAMLIELASRVRYSAHTSASGADALMHGEEAAIASGLIPEGATLTYDLPVEDPDFVPQTDAERLAAAKAAIAGLTGKPVSGMGVSHVSGNLVNVKEPPLALGEDDYQAVRDETREALNSIPGDTVDAALRNAEDAAFAQAEEELANQAALAAAAAGVIAPEPVSADVPDWFVKAQRKANRTGIDNKPAQRSRYATALDAANEQSSGYFEQASAAMEQRYAAAQQEEIADSVAEQPFEASESDAVQQADRVENAAEVAEADASVSQPASMQDAPAEQEAAEEPAAERQPASDEETPVLYDVIERDPKPAEDDAADKFAGLPSFMNPFKVQQEAQLAQDNQPRTADRVSVTVDPSASTGRILVARPASSEAAAEAPRRAIQLPDVNDGQAYAPVAEMTKQRAPLADGLPSISPVQQADESMPDNRRMALRSLLPSLSGSMPAVSIPEDEVEAPMPQPLSEPVGLTGSFAPINEELMSGVNPEDIYVDDADDSAYGEEFTQTGAFAGAGYVDMPTSRASKFFGRFRKKKAQQDVSAQEWLNVDADFDARTVGKQRGSWESFRQEDQYAASGSYDSYGNDAVYDSPETYGNEASYDAYGTHGSYGAYDEPTAYDAYDTRDVYDETAAYEGDYIEDLGATTAFQPIPSEDAFDSYFSAPQVPEKKKRRFPWQGGAFSEDMLEALERTGSSSDSLDEAYYSEGAEAVREFHSSSINTEVWFVALGAELEGNAGMKAFLDVHDDDLRGAIIVDIDSLGAGDLCLIDPEGVYKKVRPSSRMKRFLKKASQVTGVRYNTAGIHYQDSAASVAIKNGNQAVHLAGMAPSGKAAFFGEAADTVENIDAELLEERAAFLMEFVKAI